MIGGIRHRWFGAKKRSEVAQFQTQRLSEKRWNRIYTLILRPCPHILDLSQMIEERHNLSRDRIVGMNLLSRRDGMVSQELVYPLPIRLLQPQGKMFDPHHLPQLLQQLGLVVGNHVRSLCREHFQGIISQPPPTEGINATKTRAIPKRHMPSFGVRIFLGHCAYFMSKDYRIKKSSLMGWITTQ